jgi:transcriptional regulator with AAA-type ATPase domain
MTTLNEVLDAVMELPVEQQEMLIQIVRQRTIENRREEIAHAAEVSISEFRSGKLKAQTAAEVISDLRLLLETDE